MLGFFGTIMKQGKNTIHKMSRLKAAMKFKFRTQQYLYIATTFPHILFVKFDENQIPIPDWSLKLH